MKSRPILFSAPMVCALLDGSKTQTRRVAKIKSVDAHPQNPQIHVATMEGVGKQFWVNSQISHPNHISKACPYGQVGDQLWVRETWRTDAYLNKKAPSQFSGRAVKYQADGQVIKHGSFFGDLAGKTRASIHMPRWASRITLEITSVRVERLQDISEADAIAEGIVSAGDGNGFQLADTAHYSNDPRESYASLWESINGAGSWDLNPWVWVIEFRRLAA